MTKNRRLLPKDRRAEILSAAIKVAEVAGYHQLTREQVANNAGCAESLISAHFGTMVKFKRAIMREAVRSDNLTIIGQGLAMGDPHAKKANIAIIDAALKQLR